MVDSPSRRVLVVPSRVQDIYRLSDRLRHDDRDEITCLGVNVKKALRLNFRHSVLRRTAFVDGQIAAVWGVCGDMLSDIGSPFLMTTPAVERVPLAMVKTARRELEGMLALYPYLEGHVAASYSRACKFLEMLGFTLGAPEPMGTTGALFRSFRLQRS